MISTVFVYMTYDLCTHLNLKIPISLIKPVSVNCAADSFSCYEKNIHTGGGRANTFYHFIRHDIDANL